ncbi:aldehyde reductase 2 [Fusarium albosuccineum]|uniref:Aldehyde reductase 2 n=1 Tax=Fusarium albosuccineum TaxID=1237068 RepID=A0A8H4PJ59_9HYPO|nr:aldehyde reductase 2 [Fusarium albosuccineum]
MSSADNFAVPKGSVVLVTGANGLVGSHVANQFLQYGYKVRGTVRDLEKSAWLTPLFDEKHGKGNFELYHVPDMVVEGAYDEAIKGVSAVAHTASILSMNPDPNKVIPVSVAGAVNALKAAYGEPTVKRFVLTSSSSAAVLSGVDKPGIVVTEDTWNEESVKEAWSEPPYPPEHAAPVYAASKTQSEQEIWKFHKENRHRRPDLTVNTILPNFNFGKVLDPINQGYSSSAGLPVALWKGHIRPMHHLIAPQYYIDNEDTGRLHVAAVALPHVQEQRIFGFAERFSWDVILEILRKNQPDREFPANFSGGEDPNEIQPRGKAEQLLRELGRPGWTSLDESIRRNVEDIRAAKI